MKQITYCQTDIHNTKSEVKTGFPITIEMCPHCDTESQLLNVYVPQPCEHCYAVILPCSIAII